MFPARLIPHLALVLLFCTCAPAKNAEIVLPAPVPAADAPERELRGIWLASVLNIDYPSNPTPDAATLQADFRSQVFRLRKAGVNALFVQVRPAADALYPSQHAPWSQYLTGQQGRAPTADFDPLAFMIDHAHAQGMEFHAWINPYRVAMDTIAPPPDPKHIANRRPEWVRTHGGRRYLDPGLPAVRAHLGEVIDELVANYDLDGVHFDDYFYPYPAGGLTFPDSLTFAEYGGSRRLGDWRRDNVNAFIAETHARIKAAKPWVQFGISPFGVWRNADRDPARGSTTRANATSYDDLYADALAWADAGTVDYLAPQLYWSMDYPAASHRILANWWSANLPPAVSLYLGHAGYKVRDNADAAWDDPAEITRQITNGRRLPAVDGGIFFSARSVYNRENGLAAELARAYTTPALLPQRARPQPPASVDVKTFRPKATAGGYRLVWEIDADRPPAARPYYYAVYRGRPGEPARLVHRTPYGMQNCTRLNFTDEEGTEEMIYRVVGLDRWHRKLNGGA